MRRGEVGVASFKPWRGMEVGKARPCVVVQADWLTAETAGTLIVLPLTSQLWHGAEALRVEVSPRGRLSKSSWVTPQNDHARPYAAGKAKRMH